MSSIFLGSSFLKVLTIYIKKNITMRPRNVLTETNNMRRLMGLPLLKEDTGDSIKDIKKKVLNEDLRSNMKMING